MARQVHQIISTSYGEVMVKQSEIYDDVLECWIGDNFDEFVGEISGSVTDDEISLEAQLETLF